jgi:hypothetical protein
MSSDRTAFETIIGLVREMRELEQRAAQEYRPVVDDIRRSRSQDIGHIERTLDGLLDFCGFEPVLEMYKQLCRHYWDINSGATAYYVNAYRERWDGDEQTGQP